MYLKKLFPKVLRSLTGCEIIEYNIQREEAPARMCMEVSALASPELLIEIEMIALAHQQE